MSKFQIDPNPPTMFRGGPVDQDRHRVYTAEVWYEDMQCMEEIDVIVPRDWSYAQVDRLVYENLTAWGYLDGGEVANVVPFYGLTIH